MKKRMLAFVLALTIIAGLGGQAWAEVLPAEVSPSPEVSTQPEESATPEESAAPAESETSQESAAPTESVAPEGSAAPEEETDEAPVETPILDETYALPGVEDFAVTQAAPRANASTIDTVSPVGTTINLFDYWFDNSNEYTYNDFSSGSFPWLGIGGVRYGSFETKINQGHALKFHSDANGHMQGANIYTGSTSPYQGIVQRNLEKGYPVLNYEIMQNSIVTGRVEAGLGWYEHSNEFTDCGIDPGESLAYLFDPGANTSGRAVYTDVKGLLKVSEDGYYEYDCANNFAEFYPDGAGSGSFTVYDQAWNMNISYEENGKTVPAGGQFFPFNRFGETAKGNGGVGKYYFGMTMTTHFMQPTGGENLNGEAITYEFTGDDDVWVFIDGVLVGDLGGIHGAASLKIDFSTGEIFINGSPDGTLSSKFVDAKQNTTVGFDGNTFADGTYHTLQFFFLERGAGESNMKLKFNLVSAPESTIGSVDQSGHGVAGTTYTLSNNQVGIIASGTTTADGRLTLRDDENKNVGLQDLWSRLEAAGQVTDNGDGTSEASLTLTEQLPPGYRGAETIELYLLESNGHILLLSRDHWDTGAYAYSNSTVSMNGVVELETALPDGTSTVNLETDSGILFAVVLRREKGTSPENDNWYLMTGDALTGWNKGETPVNNNIGSVLAGYAANPGNYYEVSESISGGYEVTIQNLPGDIKNYYYLLDDKNKGNAEYAVSFYYTNADSMDKATAENTRRVDNAGTWNRVFSTNVYVANIKNRLLAQKLDPTGNGVEGATFTLYGDDYLNPDGSVNSDAVAWDTATTQNLTKDDGLDMDGVASLPTGGNVLTNGTYYLVETKAPDGHDVNPTVTKVIVDDTGVYADAGKVDEATGKPVDDGVKVSRGVGSLVKSLAEFASMGDIDATLNNIVAKFYTVDTLPNTGNFEEFTWRSLNVDGSAFVENTEAKVTYHPTYWGVKGADGKPDQFWLYTDDTAPKDAQPLGMHMKFSTEANLEYASGITLVNGEKGVYLMTTESGWSKLMMEQCSTHSQELAQKEGMAITDLTDPLRDLTDLFSGTVIVQVTDPYATSLTITTTVRGLQAEHVSTQKYSFTVQKMENGAVDGDYTGEVTVLVDEDGNPETAATQQTGKFEAGKLKVERTGTGQIIIQGLENGEYQVGEETPSTAPIPVNGENWYWQSVAYTVNGTTGNANFTVNDQVKAQATHTVDALNVYQKNPVLTVSNEVSGNMGDTVQNFTFTLVIKKSVDEFYTDSIQATRTGTDGEITLQAKDNTYTFTLKHDQTIRMEIPYGYDVTVTETTDQGYTIASCQYPTDGTAVELTKTKEQSIPTMQVNHTVEYLNTRQDTDVTITGVDTSNSGISVMIAVAAASAVIIFGCSFLMWRRRRRDWM